MTSATVTGREDNSQELKTLAVISVVHLISHYYWLVFAPLMPALRDLLDVSYTELGVAVMVMNLVSALTQAPTGFIVDRYGPRLLLFIGMLIGSAGFILAGVVPTYWMFMTGAVLIGLGNAVYHPADFSVLSAEMNPARMGRAFSVHSFMGYIGFAIAPPMAALFLWIDGVRLALIGTGVIGILVSLLLLPGIAIEQRNIKSDRLQPKTEGDKISAMSLMTPAVIGLTIMFTTLNMSTNIVQTFLVVALDQLFAIPHNLGNGALTSFLTAMVVGILLGGLMADRVRYQSSIASIGLTLCAVVLVVIAVVPLSIWGAIACITLAGFLGGIIIPSRDLLVRQASPPKAVGRTFGIVTTGFNFGGMVAPVIGGVMIDHHLPAWVFYGSAIFTITTVVIALVVDRRAKD